MPHTRQEKPLSERLKAFFRVGKTSGFPHPSSYELQLSPEIVEEISSNQPTQNRLRVLRDFGSQVLVKRLPSHGVELLWCVAKQGLQIADEPVHVPLARGLVDDILVVVVAQAPAQLFVVHLRLVLPHTPPPSHLRILHHFTPHNNVSRNNE